MNKNNNSSKNKVLVTGGAGFIGLQLAKHLLDKGNTVHVCDNLFRGKMDQEFSEFIEQKNVTYIQMDLTKPEEFSKLDKDYNHVYHLAAINGTKHFYNIPDAVLRTNILSVINILDWFKDICAKNNRNSKILFSSSSETYAGTFRKFGLPIPTPENVPLTIEDTSNPRWSYGGSKIIGELLFINYARQHKFKMSMIRYHNIYGPRMGFEHVMPEFIMRILKKEKPFSIFGGEETRAFCYIDDAVEATRLVMESEKTNNQMVHIGNSNEEVTIINLAKILFTISKETPDIEVKPAPEGSVQRRCPDISKLQNLTGFKPKISIHEGLNRMFVWYKTWYQTNK